MPGHSGTTDPVKKPTVQAPTKPQLESLKSIIRRYQKSAWVELDLEKTVVSEILGREKVHTGKAFLAAKRFRLEIQQPDRSLIVFDGKILWNVQYPADGDEGQIQVAKAKLDQKNQNQILLGDLLVEEGLLRKFDLLAAKSDGNVLEVTAKPKSAQVQISDLKFRVNLKDKVIQEIEYSDDLGNQTTMKFAGTNFRTQKNPKIFQYQPEKGAQVTEL